MSGDNGKKAASESRLTAATAWLERGAALVPVQPKSKRVIGGFGSHQLRLTLLSELSFWLADRDCNFAVVLSAPGFVCLDFDDCGAYAAWRSGPGASYQGVIDKTARGYHVFFRAVGPVASCVAGGVELKTAGLALCAPSVGPTGFVYQQLTHCPIPALEGARLPAFSPLSEPPCALPAASACFPFGSDLLTRIKASVPVLSLLPEVKLAGRGRYKHACCPFHKDERASFWIDSHRNLWGCLAASCPQRGTHDVINLYAALAGVTLREAIRQLARRLA